jgi:uncharacterized protein YqjF (DUF2071 family)
MNNSDLLNNNGHRPFAVPQGPWVMKQIWHDLLLAHWHVSASYLRPLIPKGIELDVWEDKHWISIIPFHISGMRFRGLPPFPYISRFPELNVRTYVTVNGKPGIYFFSLEAARRLNVECARLFFHLPYMYAQMSVNTEDEFIHFSSTRLDARGRPAQFDGTYRPAHPQTFHAKQGTLLYWLTERYCQYSVNNQGEIFGGDIHHLPWDLQRAELHMSKNSMFESHGILLADTSPLLTFTKRQEVLFWTIRKIV